MSNTENPDGDKFRAQFDRIMKNTMEGLEDLREVVTRASQNAKVKLDATFLRRERDRLYQQLGEELYTAIETGDLKTPPAVRDTVDRIHALVEQIAEEEARLKAEESGSDQDA